MKRITVLLALAWALLSTAAWANERDLENERGTIWISDSGVVSRGSQLVECDRIEAGPGKSLGSLSFVAGALLSGSVEAGGTFSATGSSFTVIGRCKKNRPKGVIFSGSFEDPITWTLASQTGEKLVFYLTGFIRGTNHKGNKVSGITFQMIVTTRQQLARGIGHIASGVVYPST